MDRSEAERRDRVLRAYFEGRDWDEGAESQLTRELVRASREVLPDYPYVVDHEWEEVPGRTQDGRGDLLFSDGDGAFAVVEVKSILGSGKNTGRRNDVEKQARRYHGAAMKRFGGRVEVYVYTDDPAYPGLRSPESRESGRLPSESVIQPGVVGRRIAMDPELLRGDFGSWLADD